MNFSKAKILIFLLIISSLFVLSCGNTKEAKAQLYSQEEARDTIVANFEMKGISFVAMDYPIDSTHILPLKKVNCNWIAQMPFAFCPPNSPKLRYDPIHVWWGETDKGIITTTQLAKKQGIRTMLKPQIWMHGAYTGDFQLSAEADWQTWEKGYQDFIFHFARLADSLQIELFCIGTELKGVVKHRPVFWTQLIDSIRTIYKGKLIYAADWADYQDVGFWDKLDYIGIDAYFPLSKAETPTTNELLQAWKKKQKELQTLSVKHNKAIIFTEIGYKSVDKCTHEPWNPSTNTPNLQAQSNAYQAFFTAFANQSWFKGAFIWKWYPDPIKSGEKNDTDFTPQNKPAEGILRKYF